MLAKWITGLAVLVYVVGAGVSLLGVSGGNGAVGAAGGTGGGSAGGGGRAGGIVEKMGLSAGADAKGALVYAAAPKRGGGKGERDGFLNGGFLTEGRGMVTVGMQIQRTDWIERYEKSMDEIAAMGADGVKIVVDGRQENGRSSQIYLDLRMTPSAESLQRLIRYAKSKGLKVILMPIVLLDRPASTEWRGTLAPENWNTWFESYRAMMGHFAWIAQSTEVDLLVVGSELVSSENKEDQWRKTIDHVRKTYKGPVTYSSNWDRYGSVPFWDALDVIGMNSYWKLDMGKEHKASVEDIKAAWEPIMRDVLAFSEKTGKPVFLMEVGWCSLKNAAHEPWDYTARVDIDNELQKRLYEGFFSKWWGQERLAGFSVWEWPPGEGGRDSDEGLRRGYTPENKPAEMILRQWLRQERWKVE